MVENKKTKISGNCTKKWVYLSKKNICFRCDNNSKMLRFVHDTWDTSKSNDFEHYCPFEDCSGGGSYIWMCFKCKTHIVAEEDEFYEE